MTFSFAVDGVIDENKFLNDLENQRSMNGFPPLEVEWVGNGLTVTVNSSNMPESSIRQIVALALGRQQRKLI